MKKITASELHSVAIIGNQNVGKTTLFNIIGNTSERVGNWSGVTIKKNETFIKVKKERNVDGSEESSNNTYKIKFIDTPGITSLYNRGVSLDQKITLSILEEHHSCIINVIDEVNIERDLYLTLELVEKGIPVLIVINEIYDIGKKTRKKINYDKLSEILGCKVFVINTFIESSIQELREFLFKDLDSYIKSYNTNNTSMALISQYLSEISPDILSLSKELNVGYHEAIELLMESDINRSKKLITKLSIEGKEDIIKEQKLIIQEKMTADDTVAIFVLNSRYKMIRKILQYTYEKETLNDVVIEAKEKTFRGIFVDEAIKFFQKPAISRILGLPVFGAIMFIIFYITLRIGNILQEPSEKLVDLFFVDAIATIAHLLHTPNSLIDAFVYGIGTGVKTIVAFLPLVIVLYILLSILEESGYMMHIINDIGEIMRELGLSSKSIIPMTVSFSCNVPAIFATRIIRNNYQRIATIMLAPFAICSAKLTIFALFSTILFQSAIVVVLMYLTCLVYIYLFSKLSMYYFDIKNIKQDRENRDDYTDIDETTTVRYSFPNMKLIMRNALSRSIAFIQSVGKVIIITTTCLHFLNVIKLPANNDGIQDSLLSYSSKKVTVLLKPIGITEDNWPATASLITGILAKEVIIGNLTSLYNMINTPENELPTEIKYSVSSWFEKLKDFVDSIFYKNKDGDLETQNINKQNIIKYFGNNNRAFSYLIFILLYCPCITVISAIAEEINTKTAFLASIFSTFIAYITSFVFYQYSLLFNNVSILRLLFITLFTVSVLFFMLTFSAKILNRFTGRKYA